MSSCENRSVRVLKMLLTGLGAVLGGTPRIEVQENPDRSLIALSDDM
jgi:hypothetical protein